MIEVTRLNGSPMTINSDLIKIAEASPDTVLTLIHGEKLMVRESPPEIIEKIILYRARLLAALSALGSPADLNRAVALCSHLPDAGKPPARTASAIGPTLVLPADHPAEASL